MKTRPGPWYRYMQGCKSPEGGILPVDRLTIPIRKCDSTKAERLEQAPARDRER